MEHVVIPLICAPYVGARVVLDKNGAHYTHYNSTQAEGNAGTVVKILDEDPVDEFLDGRFENHILRVLWDNGHQNSYRLKDVAYTTPEQVGLIVRSDRNSQIITGDKVKRGIQHALDQQILGVASYETLEIVDEQTFVDHVERFVKLYHDNGDYYISRDRLKPHYDSALAYLDTIRQDSTVLDN